MLESKKVRTVLILTGLLLFAAGALSSWTIRTHIDGDSAGRTDLPFSDDARALSRLYFVSKMVSLAGFLLALVPSTVAIKYELQEAKDASPRQPSAEPPAEKVTESSPEINSDESG